jgi:hypothetical protein
MNILDVYLSRVNFSLFGKKQAVSPAGKERVQARQFARVSAAFAIPIKDSGV